MSRVLAGLAVITFLGACSATMHSPAATAVAAPALIAAPDAPSSVAAETSVAAEAVQQEVGKALDRLNTFIRNGNPAITDEFAAGAEVLLLGSSPGEIAIGHEQIAAFFLKVFSQPVRLSYEWERKQISSSGDVAWLFADGNVVIHAISGSQSRMPYRLTGVLQRTDGKWLWKQFHGSTPAK